MERSDIRIATDKLGYDFIAKRVEELARKKVESTGVTRILDGTVQTLCLISPTKQPEQYVEYGNTVIFGWDDAKWYPGSFDDVRIVMQAIDDAVEEGHPLEFIELGNEGTLEQRFENDCTERLNNHIEAIRTINIYST